MGRGLGWTPISVLGLGIGLGLGVSGGVLFGLDALLVLEVFDTFGAFGVGGVESWSEEGKSWD